MRDRTVVIPDELVDLVTTDVLAHVSSVGERGWLFNHVMWIDWDGEHVRVNSPVGSLKGRNWRADPHAGISVVDPANRFRSIQASGRVTAIEPDTDLDQIDRMSRRYNGADYPRRGGQRETFLITLDRVRGALG
ncbi:MAG TPA: pyridoxamine 5'-phosphate oxidase family protein [Candidatus Limnocylindrales bacterium]|jgi:PPOX class probable F420-dependent enzyme